MKLKLFHLNLSHISKHMLLKILVDKAKNHTSSYLCAVNTHMLIESRKDQELLKAVSGATWAVTDGTPISWAFSYFNKVRQPRVAGMDITPELIQIACNKQLVVSVFGNTEDNLEAFRKFVFENHPSLQIGELISPPFRSLSIEETDNFINQINNAKTNLLFVSLGCPKQEKWMLKNSSKIHSVCLGIGNAINTVIGKEKRPAKYIQKMGLEWLYRLLQNPKRLFKRYLVTNTAFVYLFVKAWINHKLNMK